jgi:hypothetical protein
MSRRNMSGSTSGISNPQYGGIMGSGIFGHFGSFVNCQATDTSYYCSFMKFLTTIFGIFALIMLIFLVYSFFSGFRGKNSRR